MTENFKKIYGRPMAWLDEFPLKDTEKTSMHYCPGCGHGIIHRILGTVIDDLGIREDIVMVNSVGCSVFLYYYFFTDHTQAPHGRAPAVATGLKRCHPKSVVLTYQGDGDLAAIGTGEIINAARRGENISVIFVNNAIYGMTGGQIAPTTLPNQITSTTPYGCNPDDSGAPFKISEMIALLDNVDYVSRTALFDIKQIKKTEKAIKKILTNQIDNRGFSIVEILSTCPTNWRMKPVDAMRWVKENMTKYFPLGVIKEDGKINKEIICGG